MLAQDTDDKKSLKYLLLNEVDAIMDHFAI